METICRNFCSEVQDFKVNRYSSHQERATAEDWTHDHWWWLSGHHWHRDYDTSDYNNCRSELSLIVLYHYYSNAHTDFSGSELQKK